MPAKKLMAPALGVCLALFAFWPVGLYLQWITPQDAPFEYGASLLSLVVASVAALLLRGSRDRSVRAAGMSFVVTFFITLQTWLYVPQISRRWGPWKDLHRTLVQASQDIAEARLRSGIPSGRALTDAEILALSAQVFHAPRQVKFPIVQRSVTVRVMLADAPYVGVDYGEGRNCTFDLVSRRETYCD